MNSSRAHAPNLLQLTLMGSIVAVFVAVTLPNFFDFVSRQKQREARATLLDFYVGARAHFLVHGTYACGDCGAAPAGAQRFSYDFGGGHTRRAGHPAPVCAGVAAAHQTAAGFRAVATASLDGGRSCDVWSINDAQQLLHGAEAAAAP